MISTDDNKGVMTLRLDADTYHRYLARDGRLAEDLGLECIDVDASTVAGWKKSGNKLGTNPRDFFPMLIVNASGIAVGTVSFKSLPDKTGTIEVGYQVGAKFRNRGYATGGLRNALDSLPAHIQKVIAHTDVDNFASRKVLTHSGFNYVKTYPRIQVDLYELVFP